MGSQEDGKKRRPVCATCAKPGRLCLCARLRAPPLDNSVAVTILQHSLEAKHPLNSTRVARLGLKNLAVVAVTDVNLHAHFAVTPLERERPGLAAAETENPSDFVGNGANYGKFGRNEGERLDLGTMEMGNCGDLCGKDGHFVESGLSGDERLDFGTTQMDNYGDLCGKVGNCGNDLECSRFGGEKCSSVPAQMNISGNLDQEITNYANALKCGHKGGETLVDAPTKVDISGDMGQEIGGGSNGVKCNHLGCKRLDIAPAQMEISGPLDSKPFSCGNELKCSCGHGRNRHERLDFAVIYMENSNGFSQEAVNGSNVCSKSCSGCKQDMRVESDTGENWTVRNMDKCKVAYSENELRITIERTVKPRISWVSRTPIGQAAISNGFVVKKLQTKKLNPTKEIWELEEFEITIPPQSALLFPSQRSISLDAVDFEIRHLVVLDGTWAKAQRMYHENPWLQLLPHLKLDSGRVSLYSEVRHEPRAGCLSTIESIVCAMKGLGDDVKGLDNLLDVFESMIEDQRRCKDEKLTAKSQP